MTREFLEGLGLDEDAMQAVLTESSREMEESQKKAAELRALLDEEKQKTALEIRNSKVDSAVRAAGARNEKAVKALLDLVLAEESEDFSLSLDEQLKKLKEENGFLFSGDTAPRVVGKSGKATDSDFKFKFTGVR